MIAVGTKILVIKASKRTAHNGLVIPDTAQTDSQFGLVISAGDMVDPENVFVGGVVWFNPHQLSGSVGDKKGLCELYCIDAEAVLGMTTRDEAEEVFGAEFPPMPDWLSEPLKNAG